MTDIAKAIWVGRHNLYESVNVELMAVKMNAQNISEQKKGIKKNTSE